VRRERSRSRLIFGVFDGDASRGEQRKISVAAPPSRNRQFA
jgi:hypothetical protein